MTQLKCLALITFVVSCITLSQAQTDGIAYTQYTPDEHLVYATSYETPVTELNLLPETEVLTQSYPSGDWIIGAGMNIIADAGNQNPLNVFNGTYNHMGFPLMFSGEYLANSKISFSTTVLINTYQSGKEIQGLTVQPGESPAYFAVDLAAKLYLRKILDRHKFTPYVTAGPGYKYVGGYEAETEGNLIEVPKTQDITLNTSLGTYYWFNRNWGLNLNYMAKFAMKAGSNKDYKTNHYVLSFGVFYRLSNKY